MSPALRSVFTVRRLAAAGAVAVLILAAVLLLRPAPVRVELAVIGRGPLEVTLDEEGETRVRDRFVVSAPVAGRVRRIELEAGDAVRAGRTVLATFQPTAPAESPAVELRAPIDGVVLRRLRESEAMVPAAAPLAAVGDVARLEVVADYLSADAVRIRAGQEARVERWGGGGALRGRVRRIEPSGFTKVSALGVDEQRVNVIVDVDAPRTGGGQLGDRYRVDVRVIVWTGADVLRVPIGALVRQGDAWAVFAARGGRAALQPIVLGERNDSFAEVRSGLAAGDAVIVYPGDTVADGVAIATR
jgi:HlyD family secretion protein